MLLISPGKVRFEKLNNLCTRMYTSIANVIHFRDAAVASLRIWQIYLAV